LRYDSYGNKISTDSLSYDTHGNLTRLAMRPDNNWREFTFVYDAAGEKLLFRREHWHSECVDRGCYETIIEENYSYNTSGKISKIIYTSETNQDKEPTITEFFYPEK
jgi:hypothetical protein